VQRRACLMCHSTRWSMVGFAGSWCLECHSAFVSIVLSVFLEGMSELIVPALTGVSEHALGEHALGEHALGEHALGDTGEIGAPRLMGGHAGEYRRGIGERDVGRDGRPARQGWML
jgi:hypothetical protein